MSNLDDLFICMNPTRRDVKKIYRDEKYVRGIIMQNGDVTVWNGEVMHGKVIPFLKEAGIHFSIYLDKLEICWQFESWAEIQRRLILAKKYLAVLGYPMDGRVVMDTMFYTHTKLEFPAVRYQDLFEEGYELKPIDSKTR